MGLLSGYDLVRANALKVFVVFLYSPFVLAVFMYNGQVEYAMGLEKPVLFIDMLKSVAFIGATRHTGV